MYKTKNTAKNIICRSHSSTTLFNAKIFGSSECVIAVRGNHITKVSQVSACGGHKNLECN